MKFYFLNINILHEWWPNIDYTFTYFIKMQYLMIHWKIKECSVIKYFQTNLKLYPLSPDRLTTQQLFLSITVQIS